MGKKKNRRNKLKKEKKIKLITGIFEGNEHGYGFVSAEGYDDDFFIPQKYVNSAVDGDTVEISMLKGSRGTNRRVEAKIENVIKRAKSIYVGIFQENDSFGFVIPDDRKVYTDIYIPKIYCKKAQDGDKVKVKIKKYPQDGKNAEGEIIDILGNINDKGVDILSIIEELGLPNRFPNEVQMEAMCINQEIDEEDIKNRRDIREDINFTIDGEDAKDLDDAIGVKKLSNGNYRLDVHIADVSYYVKEGSLLDKEAVKRGTSVYLLDRVVSMLPVELSNGICSLNAGKDRFALSCSMEIDKNGNVVSSDIFKSVINVTERMTYTNVYKIITGSDEEVMKRYEKYIDKFKLMEEIALILKQRRLKNGYINLEIPETKIILDEDGKVLDVKKYEMTFANEIIEQFMLTANETIAEKFFSLEAPFIYRIHEVPDYDKIVETNRFLESIGEHINVTEKNINPKAFAEVVDKLKGNENERVVSTLILRTLKLAKYDSENMGHFGIASKYYCHFTSPIRRYPDLFIHRVISEYLENGYELETNRYKHYKKKAKKYAESSTDAEKLATQAERDANDIKMVEYMEDKIGDIYDGVISSVTQFGIFVELENTIEGLVRFENIGSNDYFIFDENKKMLIGKNGSKIFKIGDQVTVRVIEANKALRKISFEIVEKNLNNEDNVE